MKVAENIIWILISCWTLHLEILTTTLTETSWTTRMASNQKVRLGWDLRLFTSWPVRVLGVCTSRWLTMTRTPSLLCMTNSRLDLGMTTPSMLVNTTRTSQHLETPSILTGLRTTSMAWNLPHGTRTRTGGVQETARLDGLGGGGIIVACTPIPQASIRPPRLRTEQSTFSTTTALCPANMRLPALPRQSTW